MEWVSSKTLPEDSCPRLVYWGESFGRPLIGIASLVGPYRDGEVYWHGHGGSHNDVTHWMPLPEPPKY